MAIHTTSAEQDDQDLGHDKLRPGMLVGRYRLLTMLGVGGMAQVWAASPESGGGLARTVALKVVRPELAEDVEYSRLFIDEATIAASIHHPNVCETYELGRHEKTLFMAMEWVAGESLAGLLRMKRQLVPLELQHAARIVSDACAGLHAAHEAVDSDGQHLGVIHRDVSPPNVLVSVHGQVKVSDFGVAKARYQLHERTRTGEVKGKFGYLAPEQITGKKSDRRVDVYALGCVLYVATLGLRPFGSGPEAMSKILMSKYKRPRELNPDFPEDLEAIIVKALSPDQDHRYATAEEMRNALERWLLNGGFAVTASELGRVVKERMSKQASKGIQQLLSINRMAPNTAFQMLMHSEERTATPTAGNKPMHGDEHTETPTAGSGLVVQPPGLRAIVPVTDEDLTMRTRAVNLSEDGPTTISAANRARGLGRGIPAEFVTHPAPPRHPIQSAVRRVAESLPPERAERAPERQHAQRSRSVLPVAPAHLNTVLLVLVMVLAFAVVLLALR